MNPRISLTSKKKPPVVTIAIGFCCKEGVVVGTDSQLSYFPSTRKQPDAEKISSIRLSHGGHALIAKSGVFDTAHYFQEIFSAKALAAEITSARSIADLAEISMKETRTKLLNNFHNDGLTPEQMTQHLMDYGCEIMLAYMHENTPLIYTLTLNAALAIKNNHSFAAQGCAANIASLVLTGFDLPALPKAQSIGVMAYAIEMCKMYDSACGGRIQMSVIFEANGRRSKNMNARAALEFEKLSRPLNEEMQKLLAEKLATKMAAYNPDFTIEAK